VDLMPASFLHK